MKRIAILSDSFPPLPCGGIASAHFNLYKMLKSNGYEVRVYTYLDGGKNIESIGNEPDIFRFGATGFEQSMLNIYLKIKRKIDKWIFQIIPDKGLAYQQRIVKLSNLGSKKINRHLKKFNSDIVFIPDFGVPGLSLNKLPGAVFVMITHHNPIRYIKNPLIGIHSERDALKAIATEQKSLQKVDFVISPSLYMENVFKNTFNFINGVTVIPNLIDGVYISSITRVNLHDILKIDKSWPVIYIPSPGNKIKGEQFVVEIIRRIRSGMNNEVGFYLSGELSEVQKYEIRYIRDAHIYNPGIVNLTTNISLIKDCRLCVSPTLLECFGMALLEALFCGLPCVSFDVGGNKEFIDDTNGCLVPFLDIESMISKSLEILRSPGLYLELVENTEITRKRYSGERVFEMYKELLG